MKTKKAKLQVVLLAIFFSLIVLGSIATLSLNAGRDPLPGVDGRWASVCCGPQCGLEGDYCKGTGSYTCCK